MKKIAKIAMIGTLLAVGAAQTNSSAVTLVQNLNIALTGYAQDTVGAATFVRIGNREILAQLGTNLGTNLAGARLLLVTHDFGTTSNATTIVVRTRAADIDVTAYFSHTTVSDPVTTDRSAGGRTLITVYDIQEFNLETPGGATALTTHFLVRGFATSRTTTLRNRTTTGDVTSVTANVAGTGAVANKYAVLQGSVSLLGSRFE